MVCLRPPKGWRCTHSCPETGPSFLLHDRVTRSALSGAAGLRQDVAPGGLGQSGRRAPDGLGFGQSSTGGRSKRRCDSDQARCGSLLSPAPDHSRCGAYRKHSVFFVFTTLISVVAKYRVIGSESGSPHLVPWLGTDPDSVPVGCGPPTCCRPPGCQPRSDAGAGRRTAWPRSARLRHRGWTSCHRWERTSLSAQPGKIARRG